MAAETVRIVTIDGDRDVPCFGRTAHFAVTPDLERWKGLPFVLSHLPTGRALANYPTVDAALAVAEALERTPLRWDVASLPTKATQRRMHTALSAAERALGVEGRRW